MGSARILQTANASVAIPKSERTHVLEHYRAFKQTSNSRVQADPAEFGAYLRTYYPHASHAELEALVSLTGLDLAGSRPKEKMTKRRLKELSQLFGLDDDDRGCVVDLANFMRASKILGLSDDERSKLFKKYDADGNGVMDYEEFVAMIKAEPDIHSRLDLVCHNMKMLQDERRQEQRGLLDRSRIGEEDEEEGMPGTQATLRKRERRPSLADISLDADSLRRELM